MASVSPSRASLKPRSSLMSRSATRTGVLGKNPKVTHRAWVAEEQPQGGAQSSCTGRASSSAAGSAEALEEASDAEGRKGVLGDLADCRSPAANALEDGSRVFAHFDTLGSRDEGEPTLELRDRDGDRIASWTIPAGRTRFDVAR